MKKLLIWGTGIKAKRLCHYINYDEAEIIGFTDNSGKENMIMWGGYNYLPREEALKGEYDYIVIASSYYCEITTSLIAEGISRKKIIQADNVQFMTPNTLYFFNEIEEDTEKYKIFTDVNLFSCENFC